MVLGGQEGEQQQEAWGRQECCGVLGFNPQPGGSKEDEGNHGGRRCWPQGSPSSASRSAVLVLALLPLLGPRQERAGQVGAWVPGDVDKPACFGVATLHY